MYVSDTSTGQKVFIDSTISTGMNIFGATPGITFYYWVTASNNLGEGLFSNYDTGYIATDTDNDGVTDNSDNCPLTSNANQLDTDSDGAGNACDSDDDNDGVTDNSDAFPLNASESADTDSDGMGDNFENSFGLNPSNSADAGLDPDGDGLTNLQEFQAGRNPTVDERAVITIINLILIEE